MSNRPNTVFTFKLTAAQAQDIYNVTECMMDEKALVREIWRTPKRRAQVCASLQRFNRQLNRQYAETGVEV